jgi:hypothetical protein
MEDTVWGSSLNFKQELMAAMAIEELDLEFETEEEDKGDGSIDQGVELEFSSGEEGEAPVAAPVASLDAARAQKQAAAPAAIGSPAPAMERNVNSAQITQQAIAAATQSANTAIQQSMAQLSTQLATQLGAQLSEQVSAQVAKEVNTKLDSLKGDLSALSGGPETDIKRLNEADIKIAVAKNETEFLVDYISEAKLMEHKINQMLLKIHAKSPAFQKEIIVVKKLLADHVNRYKKIK